MRNVSPKLRIEANNQSQLLLSYVKPHKPVTISSIARWIKDLLTQSGIDTEVFKAQSTRAASTSKAKFSGLSHRLSEQIFLKGMWKSEIPICMYI